MLEEDFETALSLYEQVKSKHPSNIRPWLGSARALFELCSCDDAFKAISDARERLGTTSLKTTDLEVELLPNLRDWNLGG